MGGSTGGWGRGGENGIVTVAVSTEGAGGYTGQDHTFRAFLGLVFFIREWHSKSAGRTCTETGVTRAKEEGQLFCECLEIAQRRALHLGKLRAAARARARRVPRCA